MKKPDPSRLRTSPAVRTLAAAALSAAAAGCSIVGIRTTEEPAYVVDLAAEDVELRSYPALVLARTEVAGDFDDIGSPAFRRLAGYIFGGNAEERSIPMTAPVLQEPNADGTWEFAFVMPADLALADAPAPESGDVELAGMPPRRVAALRFSGRATAGRYEQHAAELSAWIEAHGYRPISPPIQAYYDPPWTIPWFRRNEVLIVVE